MWSIKDSWFKLESYQKYGTLYKVCLRDLIRNWNHERLSEMCDIQGKENVFEK